MRTLSAMAVAALAIAVLAGCTGAPADAGEPHETPVVDDASATPTPSSTPSPTPAPVVPDPADAATWLIDAEGIGPLRLGMPIDEAVALMAGYTVETCANPSVRFLRTDDITEPSLAFAAADDGRLSLVMLLDSTGPATAEGIRIGSTVTDVTDAYSGLEFTRHYSDRYTLEGTPGWITFATADVDDGATAPIAAISVIRGAVPPGELCG